LDELSVRKCLSTGMSLLQGWHSHCLNKENYLTMKKILIGALVCAAVAGVVYYLRDPEKFNDTVGDLKKKATDAFDKVKDGMGKSARTATENV